jgi:hypothetical protein
MGRKLAVLNHIKDALHAYEQGLQIDTDTMTVDTREDGLLMAVHIDGEWYDYFIVADEL